MRDGLWTKGLVSALIVILMGAGLTTSLANRFAKADASCPIQIIKNNFKDSIKINNDGNSLDENAIYFYNSVNYAAVGLTAGGTGELAIRITPQELAGYDGWSLNAARFYHYVYNGTSETHYGNLKIYSAGTDTEPGPLLEETSLTATGDGWVRIDLPTPIQLDITSDIWVSIELTQASGEYPWAVDAGPAVDGKGDWAYTSDSGWFEMQYQTSNPLDCNTNIEAIVSNQGGNQKPNTPSTPSGPTSLSVGQSGTFSTSATDPDGDQVQYRFAWDDGTISDWTNLVPSGQSASLSHSWGNFGTYVVKAQARDEHGALSYWSDGLTVVVSFKSYYFVHITDPHVYIPQEYWTDWLKSPSAYRWYSDIQQIASWENPPKFVVCTGDLVEYGYGDAGADANWEGLLAIFYTDGQKNYYLDQAHTIPIYFCPGNHDARPSYQGPPYCFDYYTALIGPFYRNIIENSCALFTMTSGCDIFPGAYGNSWMPEGNGLDNSYDNEVTQFPTDLDMLDGVLNGQDTSSFVKIVAMHHPYINANGPVDWDGYLDGVFWNNRDSFIQACNQYKVNLVLFGHDHWAGETFNGKWNKDGGQWNQGDGTEFVVTDAIKEANKYRDITISPDGSIDVGPMQGFSDTWTVETRCKTIVHVYDNEGHHDGPNGTGIIEIGINGSTYSNEILDNETLGMNESYSQVSLYRDNNISYNVVMESLGNDTMNATIYNDLKDGAWSKAEYKNLTLFEGSIATLWANHSIVNYTMIVKDPNGSIRYVEPTNYEGNLPPETPPKPSGPTSGNISQVLSFSTSTINPNYDNQSLFYLYDWGDGTDSQWLGPYSSGQICTAAHSWIQEGLYKVRVKAKNNNDNESEWSENLSVYITKTTILIGLFSDFSSNGSFFHITADFILWLNFSSSDFRVYYSGEGVIISNHYKGIVKEPLILGRFNALVISGQSTSFRHLRDRLKQLIAPQTLR